MLRRIWFPVVALVMATGLVSWGWQRPAAPAVRPALAAPRPVMAFRVNLGVADKVGKVWDGSLTVSAGELVSLESARPRPAEEVSGASWKLSSKRAPNFVVRAWERERLTDPGVFINSPGLLVQAAGGAATEVRFETKQGAFSVNPASLRPGEPQQRLDGAVVVEAVPAPALLSARDEQADFADAHVAPNGERWAAYVAYRGGRNEVMLVRHAAQSIYHFPATAPEGPGDYFLVKLSHDKKGCVWVVWSAQVDGNWDLYGRCHNGQALGPTVRLTDAAEPDIYHALGRDAAGNLWIVWQGFRNGKSDIFAKRFDGERWSAEERLSSSPANDWEPTVAAGPDGAVHVVWDTYDKGNYDVMLRSWRGGAWGAVMPVAETPKFEAKPVAAVDAANRLWITWNESGFHWGKDTGFLLLKNQTALYETRTLAVAVYAGGQWLAPSQDLEETLPPMLRGFNDQPQLRADAAGRIWAFFRHRTNRIPDLPQSTPNHRASWLTYATMWQGDRWMTPVPVVKSESRTDVRYGFAALPEGGFFGAWPTDHRDYEEFLFAKADVYAGVIPAKPVVAASEVLTARAMPELKVFPHHTDEAKDIAALRAYTIDSGGKKYKIFRGDVHRHTEFSMDGNNDGSQLESYRYALDAADMDFLGVSDHNGAGGPDVEYVRWLQVQACDLFTLKGKFEPLYTYERSVVYPNGHRNIIFAKRGVPTLPIPPSESKGATGAQMLYEYLKKNNGIAISHTSASNMGTDWRDNDKEVEPLVEIYQGDRVSAEYEGAPKAGHAGNLASAPGGFRPLGYVWNAWAKGYKLGIQASSDHLSTHISYACTLATDFTKQGLVDAMKARHSYGATDNIILDYRLQTGGKEYIQGDIVAGAAGARPKLVVKVTGTQPVRQIDVIRNNEFLITRHPRTKEVSFEFLDNQPLKAESYYYVRVLQNDDQMAWSSPVWLTKK